MVNSVLERLLLHINTILEIMLVIVCSVSKPWLTT